MINDVYVSGRLGRDPELKVSTNGTKIVSFSFAVEDINKKTNWINCKAFNKQGEFINTYLHKGDKAFIHARIDSWFLPEKNGTPAKSGIDFIILNIESVPKDKNTSEFKVDTVADSIEQPHEAAPTIEITSDDLPF